MLQDDVLVLDRDQQLSVVLQRTQLLFELLHVVHRPLEDRALVDSAILAADVAARALHVPGQQRAQLLDLVVDVEPAPAFN